MGYSLTLGVAVGFGWVGVWSVFVLLHSSQTDSVM